MNDTLAKRIMAQISTTLPELARSLAVRAHDAQHYGELPYVAHLEQVVATLKRFDLATPEIEAAGWLHDVLEDTATTAENLLLAGIPTSVIAVVAAVTDEPGASRKERKAKTYPKIAANRNAVAVKLADRIANVEAGGKVEMYAREHPEFRRALFNPEHGLSAVWAYLDAKFAPC